MNGIAGLRRHRWWGRPVPALLALLALLAVVLTGCGAASGTTGSSSGFSAAVQQELTTYLTQSRQPSTWQAPGPALDARAVKGKTVFLLSDSTNQFSQSFTSGVTAAAEAVGMTVKTGSGNAVATQDVQVLKNAINAHVDAIILLATQPQSVSTALLQAKAAGIPVIEAFIGDPRLPTAEEKNLGVFADATYCYSCTAKMIAAFEVLKNKGDVTAAVQDFPGSAPSDAIVQGWKDAVAKWCPGSCSTSYQHIPLTSNNTQQMSNAAQVAAQNPKTNVLLPVYDYQIAYEKPAVVAAGATNRIDIDSENADLAQMQDLQKGSAVKVNVGNPVAWDGWGAVDQTLRALLGTDPSADEKLPVRMFDTTNVKSLDLNADPGTWYGSADYASSYKKLWGVGS